MVGIWSSVWQQVINRLTNCAVQNNTKVIHLLKDLFTVTIFIAIAVVYISCSSHHDSCYSNLLLTTVWLTQFWLCITYIHIHPFYTTWSLVSITDRQDVPCADLGKTQIEDIHTYQLTSQWCCNSHCDSFTVRLCNAHFTNG
jgi:riboflavin transporter FmnP